MQNRTHDLAGCMDGAKGEASAHQINCGVAWAFSMRQRSEASHDVGTVTWSACVVHGRPAPPHAESSKDLAVNASIALAAQGINAGLVSSGVSCSCCWFETLAAEALTARAAGLFGIAAGSLVEAVPLCWILMGWGLPLRLRAGMLDVLRAVHASDCCGLLHAAAAMSDAGATRSLPEAVAAVAVCITALALAPLICGEPEIPPAPCQALPANLISSHDGSATG